MSRNPIPPPPAPARRTLGRSARFALMKTRSKAPPSLTMTEEEFYALDEDEYRNYEYLDGQLVREPSPTDPRYREARIPEIWLMNRMRRFVLVELLGPDGYSSRAVRSGRLASTVIPGFWIDVD